jgi:hypothetical protein
MLGPLGTGAPMSNDEKPSAGHGAKCRRSLATLSRSHAEKPALIAQDGLVCTLKAKRL